MMASEPQGEATIFDTKEVSLYKQLEDYDWDADAEFQSGLQAILGSTADHTRAEHLTLRARCFYFSRKNNVRIDFNQYLAWRSSQARPSTVNDSAVECPAPLPVPNIERRASVAQQYDGAAESSEPPAPYPTSFEQIVELISTGRPIPGIKDVPDTVLEGQASQTSTARRKKPWEKDSNTTPEYDNSEGIIVNA